MALILRVLLLLSLTCFCQAMLQACSVCTCVSGAGVVRCQNLVKFPEVSSFPMNTTDIDISHSNLTSGIPLQELKKLTKLKYLKFQYNVIKNITKFGPLNLINLQLGHNDIEEIVPGAFDNLNKLSMLSLVYNRLTAFPSFKKRSQLTELYLEGNERITSLSRENLQNLPLLKELDLEKTGITTLRDGIFQRNKALYKINLANTKSLTTIHVNAFEGVSSLQTLILDNTRITSLPQHGLENLQYLSLKEVPDFWSLPPGLWNLREVYLNQYNRFLCCAFTMNVYNGDCARQGHHGAQTTPTSGSTTPPLKTDEGGTTQPLKGTTSGSGGFTWPVWTWPSQKTTSPPHDTTSKPGFTWPGGGGGGQPSNGTKPTAVSSNVTTTSSGGNQWTWPGVGGGGQPSNGTQPTAASSNVTTTSSGGNQWTWPGGGGGFPRPSTSPPSATTSNNGGGWFPGGGGGFVTRPTGISTHEVKTYTWFSIPGIHNTTAAPPSQISGNLSNASLYKCPDDRIEVKCFPGPDAFHPCEDIMGYTLLTVVSAIVGLVALLSNLVVGVVLITSQRRLNVTRFLMCNLAFADFCLGLYIFILTCFSIETHGEYYNYVRLWQHGVGCKVLGFLAVFSSELSLFTLVVMTVERFYAIVYAMQLNTRLSFRWSVRVMLCGWVFAIIIAVLPLTGASSYDKVAVCLPFDVTDAGSTVYVSFLLLLNGCSFILVVYLYARMLMVVVKGGDMEGAPKRNDKKVAKRMALLVFTDMACWAPIAFFGLLAAFGAPLINVTESKVLLVFFFPINSVCNPFLYAFFTKAFKREFYALLSRFGFCKLRALKYNGTLSSVLYSRSRRNHTYSNDDRLKRISTVSSPTQNDFKRISTISSPSFNDFKQSNVDLVGKARENGESIQMNGISNLAYSPDSSQTTPKTTAKFVKSPSQAEDDEVFIASTSSKPSSATNTPQSTPKRISIVEKNPNEEKVQQACNNIDSKTLDNGECVTDQKDFSSSHKPASSSPKSILKKTSIVRNVYDESNDSQYTLSREDCIEESCCNNENGEV